MECSESKILIGDFNLIINPDMDRLGSTHNKHNAHLYLMDICDELLLTDIWRAKNPELRRYSWYRCHPRLIASRIDFALTSQGMVDMCDNTGYITGIHSDHLAFYLYLSLGMNARGPGYWKLNCSLLSDTKYVQVINDTINEVLRLCSEKSIVDKWEFLKFRLREVSMEFSRNNASEINLIIAQLSEKVCELQHDINENRWIC